MEAVFDKVCQVFNFNKLNTFQMDAIQHILEKHGDDIFINLPTGYGKSIIYQAIPVILDKPCVVLVISPLVSLMKDQVARLNSCNIPAVLLSDINSPEQEVMLLKGEYSMVFGSPESWLKNDKWRKMAGSSAYRNRVKAVAIDEAHVINHWGKSKNNKYSAFRVWFSRLSELRSLLPGVMFIALTATATTETRNSIFEALEMKNPFMILESPNKPNISYVVQYMPKTAKLSDYLTWITKEVASDGINAPRTIIYCQTIKQCAIIYSTLKALLGDNMYVDVQHKNSREVILEMLHSSTPDSNKQNILESFQSIHGTIHILVATISFGMGIDCKNVGRVIHFGPAKNVEAYMQETGRAGRDGSNSTVYLLYQSLQLLHVEKNMKDYLKLNGTECRRNYLLQFFDTPHSAKQPLHLCCDNCSLLCKCQQEDCKVLSYPVESDKVPVETLKERKVLPEHTLKLRSELQKLHKMLLMDLLKRDASGKLKVFSHPNFILGFSSIQISQVISNCRKLFTIRDICNLVEIWDLRHAHQIYDILQNIFEDMDKKDNMLSDDCSSDEDDDLLPDDWEEFGVDEELAMLAIDELSFNLTNVTDEDENNTNEVSFTVLNALLNSTFDAMVN